MENFAAKFKMKRPREGDRLKWIPQTGRDAAVIFLVTIISCISLSLFHLYLYFDMLSDDYFSSRTDVPETRTEWLNIKELTSVLNQFAQKQKTFEVLSKTPMRMADPAKRSAEKNDPGIFLPPSDSSENPPAASSSEQTSS